MEEASEYRMRLSFVALSCVDWCGCGWFLALIAGHCAPLARLHELVCNSSVAQPRMYLL